MPVRIYDIAKRLKIESKAVLAKALELGITSAKKPSSSLDKITAEYLIEQIESQQKAESAPEPEEAVTSSVKPEAEAPVAKEPAIKFVTEPKEEPTAEISEPDSAADPDSGSESDSTGSEASEVPVTPATPAPEEPAAEEVPGDKPQEAELEPKSAQEIIPATEPRPVEAEAVPAQSEESANIAAEVEKDSGSISEMESQSQSDSDSPSDNSPQTEVTTPAEQELAKQEEKTSESEARPVSKSQDDSSKDQKEAESKNPSSDSESDSPRADTVESRDKRKKEESSGPRVGEKVGFINLSGFGKPAAKGPKSKQKGGRDKEEKRRDKDRPGNKRGERDRDRGRDRDRDKDRDRGASKQGGMQKGPGNKPAFRPQALPATAKVLSMKPPIVVRDLATAMNRKPFQVIADLMELKVIANVNQAVDEDVARQVCAKHGFRFEIEKRERGGGVVKTENPKRQELDPEDKQEQLKPRPPVVTIMGHVDHGKTTLLDTIRKTNVVAKEAGGITQHIGAYTIEIPNPENKKELKPITFLDTPGHAAFSAMRARGANVTDIVVLVVAASEGVLPQTVEALSHARAAGVPIIVAVNKCDHPNANPTRIRQQMQERDLLCEEWGGETIFQDVSALTGENVEKLLELILLQAEILELKANPDRRAVGNVIESGVEAGGPTATLLVRKGTLKVGDVILCEEFYGKARALIDEAGKRVKEVGPSTAVKVLGLNGSPDAGSQFIVVESDKLARQYAEETQLEIRMAETERKNRVTLENLFQTLEADSAKILKVVVKADTQGSVEAIVEALGKIHSDKVSMNVIHHAVGTISESDVLLCSASNAIILGFHTRQDKGVPETAKREGVQIKTYAIIYELVEEVKQAMAGLLDPIHKEVTTGAAEVRQVFSISKTSNVAGCMVTSGKMSRGRVRVLRKEQPIYTGMTASLRRFQDEVNEVRAGMECGIRIDGFDLFEEGDVIECYALEQIAQEL